MSPDDPRPSSLPDLAAQLSELEDREATPPSRVAAADALYRATACGTSASTTSGSCSRRTRSTRSDVEYVVQDGKVLIVDEFTGRLMPGRRYSDGLHQAIEAKEGVKVEGETQTLATITIKTTSASTRSSPE